MTDKNIINIEGMTDTGLIRAHNEDSIGNDLSLGLAVLADGMGGHKGGEVASALAVNTLLNDLPIELERCKQLEMDIFFSNSPIKQIIEHIIHKAARTTKIKLTIARR